MLSTASNSTGIPMAAMDDELQSGDPIFLPSEFWKTINSKNVRMLEAEGLANFKRTVSQNYFNWFISDYRHPLFQHAFAQWCRRPSLLPFLTRLRDFKSLRLTTSDERIHVSAVQRHMYRLYTSFVWTIMMREDHRMLRRRVGEPTAGNPFRLMYGSKLISQDLANSIIECNLIADLTPAQRRPRIGELGAGYGRVAHVYASTLPGQYFIFDIPPALAVAQWYLEKSLGKERIFQFRHFDRLEDVEAEMEMASVVMLTANQLEKFPAGYFDIMLSISTLPEMRLDQANFYIGEFQRLARNHIFLKQWANWINPDDGTNLTAESYNFGPEWQLTMDRTDPVIPEFFDRIWTKSN